MLAAFDSPRDDGELQSQLASINEKIDTVQQGVEGVHHLVDDVQTMVVGSRRQLADLIGQARAPCPCLFTISPTEGSFLNPLNWFKKPVRLTLWCEYQLKPVASAAYDVRLAREWVEEVRPVSEVLLRMLQVASVVVAGVPLVLGNVDRKMIDDTLRFFDESRKVLAEADPGRDPGLLDMEEVDSPRLATGPEVKALQKRLQEHDKTSKAPFGGMGFDKSHQRVLWVDPAIAQTLDSV